VHLPRPGLDGLGILPAGLAKVGVQIDKTGHGDKPRRVDDLGAGGGCIRHKPVADQKVGRRAADDGNPAEKKTHALPPSSR
jgi:hypothetical protein